LTPPKGVPALDTTWWLVERLPTSMVSANGCSTGPVTAPFPPEPATGPLLAPSILSPLGQKILADSGFKPVAAPDAR
jgi:hypothetical protein